MKKKDTDNKSNPLLGWIALFAVIAAIAVFAFTRKDTSSVPEQQSTQPVAQNLPPAPAATSTTTPPQTQTAATQTGAGTETQAKAAQPVTPADHKQVAHDMPISPVSPQAEPEYRMPAFFENPDAAEPLAPTLDPETVEAHAKEAYEVAKRKPRLLAQLPCFCYCDRFGHKSLHDCYASNHAEECDVCMREAIEADQMDAKGMSPQEIRAMIIASHHPRS